MAANKKRNPLNYTGLDYDSIRSQIEYELNQDPNLENFRDSTIAKTLLDIFAATTDITNYYIERRAEEQFLDTARLRSSVIQLSRMLGYSPTRPIPANSALSIVLKGPLPGGLVAGDTITFQKLDAFEGNGIPFILKNSYTYTFTSDDITGGASQDWSKQIDYGVVLSASDAPIPLDVTGGVDTRYLVDIELLQGEMKVETILGGSENSQVGQLFQKYKIDDTTFSNFYGEEDLGYDAETEEESLTENLTKVGIGQTQAEALTATGDNLFSIDRRSLVNPDKISPDNSTIPRIVLISSNMQEGVNLYFGDDRFASKGLSNTSQNIYIQYLSTLGATANEVGIIGNEITTSETFISPENNVNLTNNITFKFRRNIVTGSDFEKVESMKLNAPALFYSLDRLVTSRDYISYLKTQTTGGTGGLIKNALAWGEQEEIRNRNQLGNFRFFNIAFFSALGELYNFPSGGTYTILQPADLHNAYLEQEDDFSQVVDSSSGVVSGDGFPEQAYFNILVKENPQPEVERVQDFRENNDDHPITQMLNKLDKRSAQTVKHLYISPIVQQMRLKGTVTIGKLEDRTLVQQTVNNSIYDWLNENADFNVNIHRSDIYDLIHDSSEVKHSSIYFEATKPDQLITDWASDPDVTSGAAVPSAVTTVLNTYINSYLSNAGYSLVTNPQGTEDQFSVFNRLETSAGQVSGVWQSSYDTVPPYVFRYRDSADYISGNITTKTFYQTLMKNIYDNLDPSLGSFLDINGEPWRDSQYFKNVMFKMYSDLSPAIRTAIIDENGDLTNYSLNNEIVQLEINLSYVFG